MEVTREQTEELVNHDESEKGYRRFAKMLRRKNFNPDLFSGVILGGIIGLSMSEASVQLMIRLSVDHGELPGYMNDAFFVGISILEVMLAPYICWLGNQKRINTMLIWILISCVCTMPLFFLPFDFVKDSDDDLCYFNRLHVLATSSRVKAVIRLVLLGVMGLSAALARLCVWGHGIAALDDCNPQKTQLEFGILLGARILVLVLAKGALTDLLEHKTWLQVLLLIVPLLIKVCILYTVPRKIPVIYCGEEFEEHKPGGRDFLSSITRVFTKTSALIHISSAAVLVAAVWGFSLHNSDIMVVKYQVVQAQSLADNMADQLRMFGVIMFVVIIGYKYSSEVFNRFGVMKSTIVLTILCLLVFVILTLINCETGEVVGLEGGNYTQPACSSHCGCVSNVLEFSPVCATEEMVTYYSGCHAGCMNYTAVNGVKTLTGCTCSPNGVVIPGACNASSCYGVYNLHKMLFTLMLALSAAAISAHGTLVLKLVDSRDKSTAMGVAFAVVSLFAFVGGHLMYMGFFAATCAWRINGRCHHQSSSYPIAIGAVSGALTIVSAVVNIVAMCIYKRKT